MNDTMMHVRVNVWVYMCVSYVNTNKFAIVVIHYGPLKKKKKKKKKKNELAATLISNWMIWYLAS